MIKIKVDNYIDLDNTITCGQIFRYIKETDNSYTVILPDRVINIKKEDNVLFVESNKMENLERIISDYFDLDRDYLKIIDHLKKMDVKLNECLDSSKGLKIIKQDPLECIISYVISQNNSVRNIQNSLNLISKYYGEKVVFNNKEYYLFPSLEKLSIITLEDFRKCKVGFRDKYLINIINNIVNNQLVINNIYNMNSSDALDYLMNYKGIGMKVASCILLFAYQKYDVYPVDTWVKKYMNEVYGITGEKNIKEFANKTYEKYSGLAIQYMFNNKRNK